jgi:hypothetical protein
MYCIRQDICITVYIYIVVASQAKDPAVGASGRCKLHVCAAYASIYSHTCTHVHRHAPHYARRHAHIRTTPHAYMRRLARLRAIITYTHICTIVCAHMHAYACVYICICAHACTQRRGIASSIRVVGGTGAPAGRPTEAIPGLRR